MDERAPRWRGRRVLVTGGTGFLGGWVVRELLAAGADVVGLIRDRAADAEFARHRLSGKAHIVHGRVEDGFRVHSALAVHEVSAVFHLANAAEPADPDRGTATVLDAVRRYDPRVPVVLARPSAEASSAAVTPAVPLGVARFGELFGGGDRKTFRVVPATVIGLVTGDRPPLSADPGTRDFVYVRDAARACLRLADGLADRPGPHRLDVTFRAGWELSDRAMADAVRATFEGRIPESPPVVRTENPLGWRPATGFPAALGEAVAWYREFLRTRFFGTRPAGPPRRAAA